MDAFQTLRKQARDKRDSIFRAARAEYRQACKRINALREELGASSPRIPNIKLKSIVALIEEVTPQDRTFTIAELIDLLVKAEPGRSYLDATIREYCTRLVNQGVLRRVSHTHGRTLWASTSYAVPAESVDARRMPDVAAKLLREHGPMRTVELLTRIRESGYRVNDDQTKVLKALRIALSRGAAFRLRDDDKWMVVG